MRCVKLHAKICVKLHAKICVKLHAKIFAELYEKYLNYASRHHEPPLRNRIYFNTRVLRFQPNLNTRSTSEPPLENDFSTLEPHLKHGFDSVKSFKDLALEPQPFSRRSLVYNQVSLGL